MAYRLKDFQDIIDFVMEEMKHNENDTVNTNRIKRDINSIYINEVAPYKRWRWLTKHTAVVHPAYYGAGTVSVTPASTAITFSTAPATSKVGHYFAVDAYSEVYTIATHEAGSTAATLTTAYTGTLDTAAAFKTWVDKVALPTDARETVEVWHDFGNPLEGIGQQEIRKYIQKSGARLTGRAAYYSTTDFYDPTTGTAETEADRYRQLQLYPALYSTPTTYKIDYIQEVTELDLAGDEPAMPIEDRIVLAYGALARAWRRERNDQASMLNQQLFQQKLDKMAGKVEDSQDTPQMAPKSQYFAAKKGSRFRSVPSSMGSGGGSSYQIPSYLENTTIASANVTGNITVASTVTIDGRDVSVDGATLDAHIADTTDAHDASAISVTTIGEFAGTTVQAVLEEIETALDSSLDAAALTLHVEDTDDAHDASAISVAAISGLTATNAQTAFAEHQTEIEALDAHAASTSNPHAVTKAQIGLSNVDNTSDINKPVSTAQATEINIVAGNLADHEAANNPHNITKATVGLNNVTDDAQLKQASNLSDLFSAATARTNLGLSNIDNTSDATKNAAVAVLTNKDFDGGTASNTSRITLPKAARATLDALTRKAGTVVFDTDSLKAYIDNGTSLTAVGAGSGGSKNYITDGDAEGSLIGTGYADGSAVPLATVLGTPTSTFVQSTSSPLAGTKSFLYTPGALGNGVAIPFTVDREDFGKVLTGKISLEIGGTGYLDGAIQFWIVTPSGAVVQPVGHSVLNAVGPQTHQFTFQTESTGTAYYLKMHQTTSVSTYTVKAEFSVGPQSIARGPMISDWISYTPIVSNLATVNDLVGRYRRVGDSMEVLITARPTGASSGVITFSLPTGHSMDATKLTQETSGGFPSSVLGDAYVGDTTRYWHGEVIPNTVANGVTTVRVLDSTTASGNYWSNTVPHTWGANTRTVTLHFKAPILGWSSNSVSSSEEDGRVCSFSAYKNGGAAFTADAAIPSWTAAYKDTHGGFNTTTGVYTVRIPGDYFVSWSFRQTAATTGSAEILVNGTPVRYGLTNASADSKQVASLIPNLKAGDTVAVSSSNTATLSSIDGINIWSMFRLSGPAQIAASESYNARFSTIAGQTITTTPAAVTFGTQTFSSHGSFSGSTFTANISGKFSVKSALKSASTIGANVNNTLAIYKNGSIYSSTLLSSISGGFSGWSHADEVELLAGQTMQIFASTSTGSAALSTNAHENFVSIVRVGN